MLWLFTVAPYRECARHLERPDDGGRERLALLAASRLGPADGYVEGLCERFYAAESRPGLRPGRYFRLLLIGYFEGLDAERAIAWRAADSFALREFSGWYCRTRRPITRRSPVRVG